MLRNIKDLLSLDQIVFEDFDQDKIEDMLVLSTDLNSLFVVFGNSGNTFLTCFVGSAYIFSYNKFNNIYCDEIFFLFLIPGIDTIRLILERLLNIFQIELIYLLIR